MQRKVNVVEDLDGNKIVFIHDVRFKGKRSIEWTDVETYLKEFVGESYVIEDFWDDAEVIGGIGTGGPITDGYGPGVEIKIIPMP